MTAGNKLKNLLQILESGEVDSLDDLQSRQQSPAERFLLKCAALLRDFDENIFGRLARAVPGDGGPEIGFDDFVGSPQLERVPRTERVFRVKESARQAYLQEWSRDQLDPAAGTGADFLKNLISFYEQAAPRYDLDLLGVLIFSDPARAREKFDESFARADENFDLARCHDILKTLEDRLALLNFESPAAAALRSLAREKRQYLKARSLFSAEYYQTVFFYARKSVVKAFDALLKTTATRTAKWIFHLHAPGGSGKTMFVRWLIARHCVPEPRRIPVARLDFDFLHLPTVEQHPWLLILAIAEQLNQQIEGNPFNEQLKDYWHFISLLHPPNEIPGDDSRSHKQALIKTIRPPEVETIVNRVVNTLTELNLRKPFVVVLDTLERMVLYYKNSLLAALRFFDEMHDSYPSMRLLLSGRYDLADRLAEFGARFQKSAVVHKLEPFSSTEARVYLGDKRRLGDKAIIKAIIKKCEEEKTGDGVEKKGSNPFKLSLLADFYQQAVVKTPAEILSLERTDVEYLINRIITHIKEPTVQWLLRYAVVPRRFTYDIFEAVLAPRLEEELINNGLLDKPNENFPEGAEKFERQASWKPLEPNDRHLLAHQTVWNDLRNYASSQSWISFDAGDDGAPQLHSDVVVPMRHLLQAQASIFKQLHTDAAAYFEARAKTEKDAKLWAQSVCEIIYHHFQKDGAGAARIWREKLTSARAEANPSARRIIAEEITRADYVDDETNAPLLRPDRQFLVNPADLYEAHWRAVEACVAALAAATPDEQTVLWSRIGEHLADLRRLGGKNAPAGALPFDKSALGRLTRQIRNKNVGGQALAALFEAAIATTIAAPAGRQMRLSLEILLGDLLSASNDEKALGHYETALKIRESVKSEEIKTAEIRLKTALSYRNRGDNPRAERVYRNLLPIAEKEKNLPARQKALRALAEINYEQARYDECIRLLGKLREIARITDEEIYRDAFLLSKVEARRLFEPLPAAARLEAVIPAALTVSLRAESAEHYGDVLGRLMRFDRALTELEKAKEYWRLNPVRAEGARRRRAELQFFGIGDYRAVGSFFSSWERSGAKTDAEQTAEIGLFRVLFEYQTDDRRAARARWQKMAKDESVRRLPRAFVRVLATGLALGFGDDSIVRDFIAELQKIEPVSARLPLLDAFRHAERPFNPPAADRETLKALADLKSRGRDIIPHALLRAELLRWCGETKAAENLLGEAAREARKLSNTFAGREILLARDRLGIAAAPPRDVIIETGFLDTYAIYPNLCAAACLEQAARYLKQADLEGGQKALDRAEEFMKRSDATTNQWEARFYELRGDLARRAEQPEDARKFYNNALGVYKKLGNRVAAERLRALLPQINQPAAADGEEEALIVRLETTAKTLTVEFSSGRGPKKSEKFSATADEILLKTITAETADDSSLHVFTRLYAENPRQIETGTGRFLFSEQLAAQLSGPRENKELPDLRLEAATPAAAKMPWELARLENRAATSLIRYFYRSMAQAAGNGEQIKWLQIALAHLTGMNIFIDGVFGLQTQEALKLLKKKLKLPENVSTFELNNRIGEALVEDKPRRHTKALLIGPEQEDRIRAQRGLEFSGPPPEWWYEDCYFNVETLWWTEVHRLKELVREFQPDVIHIQSSFRLMQSIGQIYLDFGAEPNHWAQQSYSQPPADERDFIQPSAAFLNDALALLPDSKMRPLVILEAICPESVSEIVRQLLYRNSFAAELFQLGNACAVLAMGLCGNGKLQGEITPRLIPALSNTQTLGSIVNSLRELAASDSLEEIIPTRGVALFTNEPLLTLLARDMK